MPELIGQQVMDRRSKARGTIISVDNDVMKVEFVDRVVNYQYPNAFIDVLILKDKDLQKQMEKKGITASFTSFKKRFSLAVKSEVSYLQETGGKRYRIIDGERIHTGTDRNSYVYSFDTDAELHFPDGTTVKLWHPDWIVPAYVVACEEFSIVLRTSENIGEKIESVEMSAEPWALMEALIDRIDELDADYSPLAYEVACKGKAQIEIAKSISLGQDNALRKAASQPVSFIWGPPGTGKTYTLARIALEFILKGKRVLMLSYSNVSVDGALMRVANMSDYEPGQIIRYGYPRMEELLESKTLTSYAFVLNKNPEVAERYYELIGKKKGLKRKDPERIKINNEIKKIREKLLEEEKKLIHESAFVATTVSKAVMDKAIYTQMFDLVIFDEASMAYVPHVVFAAGLAKESFCCLGDFRQLPAIVQNPQDTLLSQDIFEYTGIVEAVENREGHAWLTMLDTQYRMHPEIAEFASKYMYEGILRSSDIIYEQKQAVADCEPMKSEPISMIDLSDTYSVCIKTKDGSRINLMSAMVCMRLAELYAGDYGVGIVSPYSAQSRLILAMIRDAQEIDERYKDVTAATVHQYQGSEKPIIIYDAVDCFRMQYPGVLLASKRNNTANRLFNVALTRAQGKFVLVANGGYLKRKKISKDLMFTQLLQKMERMDLSLSGDKILDAIGTLENDEPKVFLGEISEMDSWERYLRDISNAESDIIMDVPGLIDDDEDALEELGVLLAQQKEKGIKILVRKAEEITLPKALREYGSEHPYITTPLTIMDRNIVWFGEPLSAADFISEGEVLESEMHPCLRFVGKHTARMLKAIFEIPTLK